MSIKSQIMMETVERENNSVSESSESEVISYGGININVIESLQTHSVLIPIQELINKFESEKKIASHSPYIPSDENTSILADDSDKIKAKSSLCPVCCVTFIDLYQLHTFECGHSFCIQCIQEFFTLSIQENKPENIKCLDFKCSYTITNEELLTNEILSKDLVLKKINFEKKNQIIGDKSKAVCPYPDCDDFADKEMDYLGIPQRECFPSTLNVNKKTTDETETFKRSIIASKIEQNINNTILDDKLDKVISVLELNKNKNFLMCSKGHKFCNECGQLSWHFDQPCIKEDNDFLHFMQGNEKEMKNCPNCGIWTEKALGCNHIKCSSCKSHWCWLCLGPYTEDHYSNTSSPCKDKMFLGVNTDFLHNIANEDEFNINLNRENNFFRNAEALREMRRMLIEERQRIGDRDRNNIYWVNIGKGDLKFRVKHIDSWLLRLLYAFALFIFALLVNMPFAKLVFAYLERNINFRTDLNFTLHLRRYYSVSYFITLQTCFITYFLGILLTFGLYLVPLIKYVFNSR